MSEGFEIPLRNGGQALVRPVTPSDKLILEEGFKHLSDDSKYNRFLSPIKSLNSRQLAYFTEIDQVNHVAWGVGIPQDEEILGIAIGRYVRLPEEPNTAEFALTVIDQFQSKGLGTFLLALLYRIAQHQGDIEILRGVIGTENNKMLKWMGLLDAKLYRADSYLMHADIAVSEGKPQLPESRAAHRFTRIWELIKEGESIYMSDNSSEPPDC